MSLETRLLPPCRLSVIIPTHNRRALTERAVQSVLDQVDPIGTEIIVADDGSRDGTPDHLETIFSQAILQNRLRVLKLDRSGDPGTTRNRGATDARGSFLAFLDSDDWWKPGRLQWLEPHLSKHDLILGTDSTMGESSDWIRTFLTSNLAITSTAVIRRTLFDEAGGFPEGYFGAPLPKRTPGFEDYELWLKCLVILTKSSRKDRFELIRNQHVVVEPQPEGAGRMKLRLQMMREAVTLMHIAPSLPSRYWPVLARRLAGAGKAIVVE